MAEVIVIIDSKDKKYYELDRFHPYEYLGVPILDQSIVTTSLFYQFVMLEITFTIPRNDAALKLAHKLKRRKTAREIIVHLDTVTIK